MEIHHENSGTCPRLGSSTQSAQIIDSQETQTSRWYHNFSFAEKSKTVEWERWRGVSYGDFLVEELSS